MKTFFSIAAIAALSGLAAASPAAIPSGAPFGAGTDSISHGNLFTTDRTYRWQQIAEGLYVGIAPEDWNKTLHTQNTRPGPASGLQMPASGSAPVPRSADEEEARELMHRSFSLQCRTALQCAKVASKGAYGVTLKPYVDGFVEWFANHKEDISKMINQPIVQTGITVAGLNGGSALIAAYVKPASDSSSAQPLSNCSTSGNGSDAIQSALDQVLADNPNAATAAIVVNTDNGTQYIVSLAIAPGTKVSGIGECGAPKIVS